MNDLPPISDDDLRPSPRTAVALPPRPDVPDAMVEAHAREIGARWGSSTQPPAPAPAPQRIATIRFEAPAYLDRELALAAVTKGVTKTSLLIQCLADCGYHVAPEDLVPDRRKVKR